MWGYRPEKCLRSVCDGLTPVAKSSISEVTRFCKRPSCALCRGGVGHQAFLFSYRSEGRKQCAYVPADAVGQVRLALANGREIERRLVEAGVALIASHGVVQSLSHQNKEFESCAQRKRVLSPVPVC